MGLITFGSRKTPTVDICWSIYLYIYTYYYYVVYTWINSIYMTYKINNAIKKKNVRKLLLYIRAYYQSQECIALMCAYLLTIGLSLEHQIYYNIPMSCNMRIRQPREFTEYNAPKI